MQYWKPSHSCNSSSDRWQTCFNFNYSMLVVMESSNSYACIDCSSFFLPITQVNCKLRYKISYESALLKEALCRNELLKREF